MAILVGQEGEGASAAIATSQEVPRYYRIEAAHTGTVTELHVKHSVAYTGKTDVAICTDNGAAAVPGEVKGEAQVVLAAETLATVSIAGVKVTKGAFYWLAFEDLLAGKFKQGVGAGKLRTGKTAHTKISEQTEWVAVSENKQPCSIWATGTEEEGGAPVTGKATGAVLLTGTAKGTAAQRVEGNAGGNLVSNALILTGSAKGQTAEVLSGKATGALLLAGTSKGTAVQRVAGKATGALTLNGTAKGSLKAVVTASAAGTLYLTGSARAGAEVIVNRPGLVSPHSLGGQGSPHSLAGLVAPHSLGGEDAS